MLLNSKADQIKFKKIMEIMFTMTHLKMKNIKHSLAKLSINKMRNHFKILIK